MRRATDEQVTFDELPTEAWNAASADLDLRNTTDLVALMGMLDEHPPAPDEPSGGLVARTRHHLGVVQDLVAFRLR